MGCLFWGTRIVVPLSLQARVLAELHASHPGIVRMKGLARGHVWWPGLNAAVEKTVFNCDACQGTRRQPHYNHGPGQLPHGSMCISTMRVLFKATCIWWWLIVTPSGWKWFP